MSEVKPTKILIVDDDDAIRNMVERVLRRERFEVESARDGFEAIETQRVPAVRKVMPKPFDIRQLVSHVRDVLQCERVSRGLEIAT